MPRPKKVMRGSHLGLMKTGAEGASKAIIDSFKGKRKRSSINERIRKLQDKKIKAIADFLRRSGKRAVKEKL